MRKSEGKAGDERERQGGGSDRHVLAVGKRVKQRWLVEMCLAGPSVAPRSHAGDRRAHAA